MASKKTRVRAVRLRNEVADWFDKHDARGMIESIWEMYERGEIGINGDHVYIIHGEDIDLERLKKVARGMHRSPEEIIEMMVNRLERY